MTEEEIANLLDEQQTYNAEQGYYSDDYKHEDLQIVPEEKGEFGTYRQCVNFELAGKGFQPVITDKLKDNYVKTKINGKTIEEKNIENEKDIQEYLLTMYGLDLKNT